MRSNTSKQVSDCSHTLRLRPALRSILVFGSVAAEEAALDSTEQGCLLRCILGAGLLTGASCSWESFSGASGRRILRCSPPKVSGDPDPCTFPLRGPRGLICIGPRCGLVC